MSSADPRYKIAYTCLNCGKKFMACKHRPAKFCSRTCSAQFRYKDVSKDSRKIEITCRFCGKKTMKDKWSDIKFCSRKCAAKGRVRTSRYKNACWMDDPYKSFNPRDNPV